MIRKLAAYVVLGINSDGLKEVLTIEVGENESSERENETEEEKNKNGGEKKSSQPKTERGRQKRAAREPRKV